MHLTYKARFLAVGLLLALLLSLLVIAPPLAARQPANTPTRVVSTPTRVTATPFPTLRPTSIGLERTLTARVREYQTVQAFTAPTVAARRTSEARAATPLPAPGGRLPAPLFALRNGRIYRLATDGRTITQLTLANATSAQIALVFGTERAPDGSVIYLDPFDPPYGVPQLLVRFDPKTNTRTVLIDQITPGEPALSPDGTQIAVRLSDETNRARGLVDGVYLLPLKGGAPQLVLADRPLAIEPQYWEPETDRWGFIPTRHEPWSPDGARLMLEMRSGYNGVQTALYTIATGEIQIFAAPDRDRDLYGPQCVVHAGWLAGGRSWVRVYTSLFVKYDSCFYGWQISVVDLANKQIRTFDLSSVTRYSTPKTSFVTVAGEQIIFFVEPDEVRGGDPPPTFIGHLLYGMSVRQPVPVRLATNLMFAFPSLDPAPDQSGFLMVAEGANRDHSSELDAQIYWPCTGAPIVVLPGPYTYDRGYRWQWGYDLPRRNP